jgi:hypothetical protein
MSLFKVLGQSTEKSIRGTGKTMSVFDLKPLTAKTIEELKLRPEQLWEIKIDENIYGPFETLQLKHYSKENRSTMLKALVSPMSVDDWRPFFEVRDFLHETKTHGPYWILTHGQKSSPLPKEEVAKRIELGTITRHDEISEDEGRHWHRISNHPEFEPHFTTGTSLPQSPQEASFNRAKIHVLEKLEAKVHNSDHGESIASLAHVSLVTKEKTKTLNIENLPLERGDSQSSFWENHKPHFFVALSVAAIALYFVWSPSQTTAPEIADATSGEEVKEKSPVKRSKKDSWSRSPANYDSGNNYDRSGVTQQPNVDDSYPTVIETHQEDQNYPDPSAEADQVAEIEDQEEKGEGQPGQKPREADRDPAQEGESLDGTMNNEGQEQPNPAVDQPVVEEVSDF